VVEYDVPLIVITRKGINDDVLYAHVINQPVLYNVRRIEYRSSGSPLKQENIKITDLHYLCTLSKQSFTYY